MKCYTHNQIEAVAVCVHCGRTLCVSCASPSSSGRLVCSPACASASKRMEEFVADIRNKNIRGLRTTAYMSYYAGVLFIVGAILIHRDLHIWPMTLFFGALGITFFIAGFALMRVAKRNSEQGAT